MEEGLVGRHRNQKARRAEVLNQGDQRGKVTDEGGNGMRKSKREKIIRGKIEGRKRAEGKKRRKKGLERKESNVETSVEIK